MSITLNPRELKAFRGIDVFRGKLVKELAEAARDAVNAVQNRAKEQIAKGPPRTGNPRPRRGRKAPSVASRKGEYPKADTGTLGRSIMARYSAGALEGTVGSHLQYAEELEKPRLDRRHISRANEEMGPFIANLARQAIRNSARKTPGNR
jgi:hypothetical protein